ncbi:hypothetical protein ACJX0J_021410, partial [Zea mays]
DVRFSAGLSVIIYYVGIEVSPTMSAALKIPLVDWQFASTELITVPVIHNGLTIEIQHISE